MGAPIAGMIVLGVVQSLLALSTISPTLSEQFGVLVNLAVVTNVIPYIIALSALTVMMQAAGVAEAKYRRNVAIAVGRDALQRLRDLRLGQGRGARRHAGARRRLHHLGLHRPAVHVAKAACGASHAGGVTVSALPVQGERL